MRTRCFALAGDGGDLPVAVQTIIENGDGEGLREAIDDAFPGSHLSVSNEGGLFRLQLHQPGLLRPLQAAELSDGTLRFVLLAAALFSPRLPPLIEALADVAHCSHVRLQRELGVTQVQGQTALERGA